MWKQRVFWALVSVIAAYVGTALASRRFHAEVARLTDEVALQDALISEMLNSVKAGLNVHG